MKNIFTRILFTSSLKYVLITSIHNSLFKELNVKLVCHKLPLVPACQRSQSRDVPEDLAHFSTKLAPLSKTAPLSLSFSPSLSLQDNF